MRSGFATGIQVISNSSEDVDFYIHELYPIHFFGTTVYITTTHVCTFIVLLVIAILAICARRSVLKTRDNPSKFATGVELAIESLIKFVNSTMGKEAGKHYINYIGTLFICTFFEHIRLVYASAADRGLRNDALYRTCIICHDTVRIHSLPEMGCIQESVRSDIPVLPDQRDQ